MGGGTIATPLLRMFLGTSAHVAVGTTMAVIIPTSIFGAINYFRKGMVDIKIGKVLILPAMVGVIIGALLTTFVHDSELMIAFAGLVGFLGVDISFGLVKRLMELRSRTSLGGPAVETFPEPSPESPAEPVDSRSRQRPLVIGLVGLATGMMAGFFGVGGGFILVPCFLYIFDMPIKSCFGTSLIVVACVAIPGMFTHHNLGHVDLPLALAMIVGSVPGSLIGSSVAIKLKDSWLRRAFGVVMLIVAAILIRKEIDAS